MNLRIYRTPHNPKVQVVGFGRGSPLKIAEHVSSVLSSQENRHAESVLRVLQQVAGAVVARWVAGRPLSDTVSGMP